MRLPPADNGTSYARKLPNLGFDPTPGDVSRCSALARRFDDMAGTLRGLANQLGMLDFNGWRGQAGDAAKSLILDDVMPAILDASTIATQVAAGVSSWTGKLSAFRTEADALEHRAGSAAADLEAIKTQHANAEGHAKSLLAPDLEDAQSNCDSISAAANDLQDRFLAAGEAAGRDASGEDTSTFIKATEDFNKVAGGSLTPFQLVAGDAWVGLFAHLGDVLKDTDIDLAHALSLDRRSPERLQALRDLALDFEDEARVVNHQGLIADILPKNVISPSFAEFAANNADLFRGGAMLTSALGILGDLGAEISPEDKGALGDVDKGVAVVNGSVIALDLSGGLDALAAANSLDWIPGVGEGVIVTTGAYLAGDWLYHHWTPARNAPRKVADAPSNFWNGLENGFHELDFFPGL